MLHARLRQPFSIPSGTAGTNLRKTARYAGENREPLQAAALWAPFAIHNGRFVRVESPYRMKPANPIADSFGFGRARRVRIRCDLQNVHDASGDAALWRYRQPRVRTDDLNASIGHLG